MHVSFANSSGGYENVGFVSKDIYNEVARQRRIHSSDANDVFNYFKQLGSKDLLFFVSYTIDDGMRLQNLFWENSESQMNHSIFGDVLAFHVMYKKNKYLYPLVIFYGVNNHNQTIMFVAALVTNEIEETCIWSLEQFHYAMKGKVLCSTITNGDVAMKNAIRRVFFNSFYRLCVQHLL